MLGSFISFRREISRMAVDGTPSSSASRRIFLRATRRLECARSRALYTTPYVPWIWVSFCLEYQKVGGLVLVRGVNAMV